ncbi:uncharacterized protein I206_100277 [Kwoniella pini CBS 10737]|uniref:SET domain-containing protein n=1 Tax=Kwoniella pini CBS 10737 TaxID=1296096 RepID=A0A1B9IE89_9TREE|nr:uncharacterized protein I206_01048 [Kwoniella pini CBS 10737]OCF53741.1 hypothetical protein I206_01048 [Kwoniella pini CBS 10737]
MSTPPSIDPMNSTTIETSSCIAPMTTNGDNLSVVSLPGPSISTIPSTSTSTPSISLIIKEKEKVVIDKDLLPHPAEDLSADDDLLSWILVDQLGCMPNTKLGVHPQQVKFVGPSFKTDDVLNIIKETITKGNIQGAMQRLQEFHLIKSHMDGKMTDYQRERFVAHLRRYLLPLAPNSRLEIHLTSRYSFVTGHTELAIFATKPLVPGLVMQELQGSVVPLPDQWREEMEIGEDFTVAVEAAGEETDSENDDTDQEEDDNDTMSLHSSATNTRREKGKSKEIENNLRKGQRRSDRTKRRDFSIVWSGLKRCYQLFLGPARFLNHDCNPNVELLRQGKYVTFRVSKPIRVGDELTTFYGENYFGRNNIECLCLTCEQKGVGGFTPVSTVPSNRGSRSGSRDSSAGPSRRSTSVDMRESVARDVKSVKPSALRNVLNSNIDKEDMSDDERSTTTVEPSHLNGDGSSESRCDPRDDSVNATPTKKKSISMKITLPPSPTSESMASDPESPMDPPPRRERIIRKVVQNIKPWSFLQRPKKIRKEELSEADEDSTEVTDDLPSDFPRCATCAKPLNEQIWFNGRYFEHCARCIRHAFIFELPWPAHNPKDVREYPPSHLVPPGYIPRRISTIPLPTLSKQPKYVKPIEVPVSPTTETKAMARARRLRDQIAAEEFFIESLREAAWSAQEAHEAAIEAKEAAIIAAKEAKEQQRLARIEEKKKRDAMNIKGTGVWSRYAYVTEDEIKRKEAERNQVLSGTRRGGSFRARKEEEEMKKMAEERLKQEERERLAAMGINPSSSPTSARPPVQQKHEAKHQSEEEDESNVSIDSSSASSTVLVVDPKALRRMYLPNANRDDDDEMEVAQAPELSSVSRGHHYLQSKATLPPPKTKSIVKPIKGTTSISTIQLKHVSKSTVVSSPFRPIAPKRPVDTTPSTSSSVRREASSGSMNKSPIIDLTADSDDDGVSILPSRSLPSRYSQSSTSKQINKSSTTTRHSDSSSIHTSTDKNKFAQNSHTASSMSVKRSSYPDFGGNVSGRKSDGSGSSSVDVTENALDLLESAHTDRSESIKGDTSTNYNSKGRAPPRLILNVTPPKDKYRDMVCDINGKGKDKEIASAGPLRNGLSMNAIIKKFAKPFPHSSANGTMIDSGIIKDREKPNSNSSSKILSDGHVKKRKRISDTSLTSSSVSPNSHPEKKKRTFFPSSINVTIAPLGPDLPKPKHTIHET